jgi:hypothetical protein
MTARRLPPYGRQMIEARRGDLSRWWGTSPDGQHPSITVCVGKDAWRVKREWPNRLMVVCPDEPPEGFDWTCCAGADPVLLWRCGPAEGEQVRRLIMALMRDGTNRVLDEALNRFVAEVRHVG